MANAKKFGAEKIESAVRSAIERLEQRVMMAAGVLDPTFGTSGYLLQTQPAFDLADSTLYDTEDREYAYWNARAVPTSGFISNHDIFLDAGGKIVTVGATLGRHLAETDPAKYVIVNPDNPTQTMEVTVAEVMDSDISVTRYGSQGQNDGQGTAQPILPQPGATQPSSPGDRDFNANAGTYPGPSFTSLFDVARAGAVDADGSIVIVGTHGAYGSTGGMVLARYFPRSNLVTQLSLMAAGPSPAWSVNDMLIQPDGRIVVAGSIGSGLTGRDFTLWRFNPDFTLDTTFGVGGEARFNFTAYSEDEALAIAIQPQQITNALGQLVTNPQAGKIVAIGYSDDSSWKSDGKSKMVIARYNVDGSHDTSWGLNGILEIADFGGQDAIGTAIAIQSDGKVVAAGAYDANLGVFIDPLMDPNPHDQYRELNPAQNADALDSSVVVRINLDGSLDQNAFGARGRLQITSASQPFVAQSIAFESTGKIVVSGVLSDVTGSYAAVTRLTADGFVDQSYGTNGRTIVTSLGNNILADLFYGTRIAVQGDDKAVVTANAAFTVGVTTTVLEQAPVLDKTYFVAAGGLARLQADNKEPKAQLLTQDVTLTEAGQSTFRFLVNYSDDGFVDLLSITGGQDILVTGPNGFGAYATVVGAPIGAGPVDLSGNRQRYTVTYEISFGAPLPANTSMNGAYAITLLNPATDGAGNGIADTDGLYASRRVLGQFAIEIQSIDQTPPTATLISLPANPANDPLAQWLPTGNNGAIVGGGTSLDFIIEYADSQNNINLARIGTNDIVVTGPSGYSQIATFIAADQQANSPTIRARYRITAPGGIWDTTDNGVYNINLGVNEVSDDYKVPNFAAAGLVSAFNVSVVPGTDVRPDAALSDAAGNPIASLQFNQPGLDQTFYIHYTPSPDSTGDIDPQTFRNNGGAITVVAASPVFNKNATYVSDISDGNGGYIVTYSLAGPWSGASNGSYVIRVNANQVGDLASPPNYVPAGDIGQFVVNIGDQQAPTAAIVPPIVAPLPGAATFSVTVAYSDDLAIDATTIDAGDIRVVRDGDLVQLSAAGTPVITPAGNGTPRNVTYTFNSLGTSWNYLSNGTWTIQLQANQVRDTAGNAVAANASLGSFVFADQPPVLTQIAYTVPTVGMANFTVAITLTDETGIDVATVTGASLFVERVANGTPASLVLANITPNPTVDNATNGTPRTFTFTFAPLGGYWESNDNGTYEINLALDGVRDVGGQGVPATTLATFELAIPLDTTVPTAAATVAPNLIIPDVETYSIEVTFTDNVAVDPAWLIDSVPDIEIVTPSGDRYDGTVVPGSASSLVPAGTISARYEFTSPTGTKWNPDDNGTYIIRVKQGTVADVSGNFAAPVAIGQFQVQIPDSLGPSVELVRLDAPALLAPTAEVVVTYRDAIGIDLTTLAVTNIVLSRGTTNIAATSFAAVPTDASNTEVTVTYVFDAPGGTWNFSENGTWIANVVANEVSDISGYPADAAELGEFYFEDLAPTATVVDPLPTFALGTGTISIVIEYRDDAAMDDTTFDANDIVVTRTDGGSAITLVSAGAPVVAPSTDPTTRQVTYTFSAPGGYWESSDNGTYTVSQAQNQVADTGGQFAPAGWIGEVTVSFLVDGDAPVGVLVNPVPITAAVTSYSFRVRYTDLTAVDFRTLGDGDVSFTGPGGTFSARALSITPAGFASTIDVVYEVTKPGGFTAYDNGRYDVVARNNQVADVSGNFISTGTLMGSVTVNVPLPAVDAFLTNPVVPTPVASTVTFQVTYSSIDPLMISSIINNNAAIRVSGPKGFLQSAAYVTVDNPTNGSPRTVTYRISAPDGRWDFSDNGVYTISTNANSGVRNMLGGTLAAKTLGTFTVALKATSLQNNVLSVVGTDDSDMIEILRLENPTNPVIRVIVNNVASDFPASMVQNVRVDALGGNDTVKINTGVPAAYIHGYTGNDTLIGGDFNDTIAGGSGDDFLVGGAGGDAILGGMGNDRIAGVAGPDSLLGEDGNDTITGGGGRDQVNGGAGNDQLDGGKGLDVVFGAEGDDLILARDTQSDTIDGGTGYDRAQIDIEQALDTHVSIEELLA